MSSAKVLSSSSYDQGGFVDYTSGYRPSVDPFDPLASLQSHNIYIYTQTLQTGRPVPQNHIEIGSGSGPSKRIQLRTLLFTTAWSRHGRGWVDGDLQLHSTPSDSVLHHGCHCACWPGSGCGSGDAQRAWAASAAVRSGCGRGR